MASLLPHRFFRSKSPSYLGADPYATDVVGEGRMGQLDPGDIMWSLFADEVAEPLS
jgi:hypothetical protein